MSKKDPNQIPRKQLRLILVDMLDNKKMTVAEMAKAIKQEHVHVCNTARFLSDTSKIKRVRGKGCVCYQGLNYIEEEGK